jgi:hypothetical protein
MNPFASFAGDAAFGDIGAAAPSSARQDSNFNFNTGAFGGNNAGAAFPAWFLWVLLAMLAGFLLWFLLK